MPPETPPPDDARRPSPSEGNVVDPEVLAERRAQRAEQAEQSAARRASDAQVLAAQLASERARLEAERDAARAEASAAREGADAAIAEARHLQAERDTLRAAVDEARAERDALAARAAVVHPPPADVSAASDTEAPDDDGREPESGSANGGPNGHGMLPPSWPTALRRELTFARAAAPIAPLGAVPVPPTTLVPGLARERRLVAQRAAAGPMAGLKSLSEKGAQQRRGDRAAPVTALALERERSSRLQAQLDSSLAVQRDLRTHIAALQRAVHQRIEAERRIETALRRVREELTAANVLAAGKPTTPSPAGTAGPPPRAAAGTAAPGGVPMPLAAEDTSVAPAAPLTAGSETPVERPAPAAGPTTPPVDAVPPGSLSVSSPDAAPDFSPGLVPASTSPSAASGAPTAAGLDPLRLSAARERLRAAVPAAAPVVSSLPAGPPAPWLTAALQRLLASEPETAGRIVVGLLPAQGLGAERPLRYDLLLADRGCFAIDVEPGRATVAPRPAPRPRNARDLSIAGDAARFARLLHGRRTLLRRPARVRGGRKALRELRRLARAPLGMRDLGSAGVPLEPALALRLVALAIDPAATQGERFAIAHAPLAGGPVDAWLRIADGAPPEVCDSAPAEPVRLTLRCTRGALLALIAGVEPPAGESGTLDGDDATLTLLRGWIAQTEHP
ncbi:MAG TPA: hypothetical protein VKB25_12425 [Conexibacter sp.]|nr:hypothetical protein [Conexibacter sp.]